MLTTLDSAPHQMDASPREQQAAPPPVVAPSTADGAAAPAGAGGADGRARTNTAHAIAKLRKSVRKVVGERRRGKRVSVGYKVNGIRNVNSIDCTFTIDFKVFYYWRDDRVKGRPKGTVVDIHEPGLFQPELIISNEAELQLTHWEFQVKDGDVGLLKLSEYYRGTLLIPNMSLHYFPFDVQNLRICIKPHKRTIDEVELHPLPDECAIEHHARHEWRVIGSCTSMYATNPEHSTTGKVYSSLHIIVLVERESDWHVRMIMLPILLIAVCSLAVYAFEISDLAGRMETAVALLLTNVATKFTIADFLPKVPYRTLCDYYLDVAFFCQFGMALSNPLIYLVHRAIPRKSIKVPVLGTCRIVEVLNALSFLCAFSMLAWLNLRTAAHLKAHRHDVEQWRKQALPASSPAVDGEEAGVKLEDSGKATAAGRLRDVFFSKGSDAPRRVHPNGGNLSDAGAEDLAAYDPDAAAASRPPSDGLSGRKVAGAVLTPTQSLGAGLRPKVAHNGFAVDSFRNFEDYVGDLVEETSPRGHDDRSPQPSAGADDDGSFSSNARSAAPPPRTRTSGGKSAHVGENSGSYAFVAQQRRSGSTKSMQA